MQKYCSGSLGVMFKGLEEAWIIENAHYLAVFFIVFHYLSGFLCSSETLNGINKNISITIIIFSKCIKYVFVANIRKIPTYCSM